MRRYFVLALLFSLVAVPGVFAAADADADTAKTAAVSKPALILPAGAGLITADASNEQGVAPNGFRQTRARGFDGRRPVLTALHGITGLVQAYDGMSTLKVLKAGGYEANPLMKGAANNQRVLVATKVGAALATVIGSERLWRGNHRTAAVLLSVLTNGAMLAVANHNAQVLKRFQAVQ